MKLHLPNLLRKALLACVSSTAAFSLTLGSGATADDITTPTEPTYTLSFRIATSPSAGSVSQVMLLNDGYALAVLNANDSSHLGLNGGGSSDPNSARPAGSIDPVVSDYGDGKNLFKPAATDTTGRVHTWITRQHLAGVSTAGVHRTNGNASLQISYDGTDSILQATYDGHNGVADAVVQMSGNQFDYSKFAISNMTIADERLTISSGTLANKSWIHNYTVEDGATLDISSSFTLGSSVLGSGTVNFAEGNYVVTIAFLGEEEGDTTSYTLAEGSITGIADTATDAELKALFNIANVLETGNEWSYSDGVLKVTQTNDTLTWDATATDVNVWETGNSLNWADGKTFENEDKAIFSGAGETVTVKGEIVASVVDVIGSGWEFAGEGDLEVGMLTIGDGTESSLTISNAGDKTFTVGVQVNENATLKVTNIDNWSGIVSATNGTIEIATGAAYNTTNGVDVPFLAIMGNEPSEDSVGTLRLSNGTSIKLTTSAANEWEWLRVSDNLEIVDGAHIEMAASGWNYYSSACASTIGISGAGAASALAGSASAAAIAFTSNKQTGFNSTLKLLGDATVYVENGVNVRFEKGYSADNHKITKTGEGVLTLNAPETIDASLFDIKAGTLVWKSTGDMEVTGTTTLNDGAELMLFASGAARTFEIDSLSVDGEVSLGSYQHGDCHNAQIDIATLSGSGIMKLSTGSQTAAATVVNLNGDGTPTKAEDAFAGEIRLICNNVANDGIRRLALNVFDGTLTSKSVLSVDTESANSSYANAYFAFGIADEETTVAGISTDGVSGSKTSIVSGSVLLSHDADFTSDGMQRTLIVNATGEYSTNATVLAGLDLVKKGAGSQIFTGNVAFGEVTLSEGTLGLNTGSLTKLSIAADTTLYLHAGGTLTLSTALDADSINNMKLKIDASSVVLGEGEDSKTYTLIDGGKEGFTLSADKIELVYLANGLEISGLTDGVLTIRQGQKAAVGNLTWQVDGNNANNTWANSLGQYWQNEQDSASQRWTDGSDVTFSGAGESITIEGSVAPKSVAVTGTGWEWRGVGSIVCAEDDAGASLTVGEGASLEITDAVDISCSGSVTVGSNASLVISTTGSKNFADGVQVEEGASLVVKNTDAWGGTVSGAGTLEFSGVYVVNTFIDNVVTEASGDLGTVRLANGTRFSQQASIVNWMKQVDVLEITNGSALGWNPASGSEYDYTEKTLKLAGAGTGEIADARMWGAALNLMSHSNYDAQGTKNVTMNWGTIELTDDASINVGHGNDPHRATLGGQFVTNGHTLSKVGQGTLELTGVVVVPTGDAPLRFDVQAGTLAVRETVAGGQITKTGAGKLELGDGANTPEIGSGMAAIDVQAGTLYMNFGGGETGRVYDGKLKLGDGTTLYHHNPLELTGGVEFAGNVTMECGTSGVQSTKFNSLVTGAADAVVNFHLALEPGTSHMLYFNQANTFAGTWNVDGKATLVAQHVDAFRYATVNLASADAILSFDLEALATGTTDSTAVKKIRVGGLTSETMGSVTHNTNAKAELELFTTGTCVYNGEIDKGIDIVMSGTGEQVIAGLGMQYGGILNNDITINSGTLTIYRIGRDRYVSTMYGTNITVQRNATLKADLQLAGGSLTLDLTGDPADAASLGGKTLSLVPAETLTTLNLTLSDDVQTGDTFTLLKDIGSLTDDLVLLGATVGSYFDVGSIEVVSAGGVATLADGENTSLRPDLSAERLSRSELSFENGELRITLAEAILDVDPLYWDPRNTNGVAAENGTGNWLGANWSTTPESMGKDPGEMVDDWYGDVYFTNQEGETGTTAGTVTIDTDAVVNNLTVESGNYTFVQDVDENQEQIGSLAVEGKLSVAAGASADMQLDIDAYQVAVQGSLSVGTITLGKAAEDGTVSAGSLTAEAGSVLNVTAVEGEGTVSINGATVAGTLAGRAADETAGGTGLSVNVSGATVATDTSLSISNAGLGGIVDNSGYLTFSGNMDVLKSMPGEDKSTYSTSLESNESGTTTGDGYLTESVDYTLVSGNGTLSNNATWTVGGRAEGVTKSTDGKVLNLSLSKDFTSYWVNNTVTQSTALLHETTERFVLNGGMLILDGESFAVETNTDVTLQQDLPNESGKDTESVIVLSGTLKSADLTVGSGTSVVLQGSGTYDIGSDVALVAKDGREGTLLLGADDADTEVEEGWTGTVSTAATSISNINALGNMNSTVELTNAVTGSGAMQADAVGTTRFKQGLTIGTGASFCANALELESLTLKYLNPGEEAAIVSAAELLNESLAITIEDSVLATLQQGDVCNLVNVSADDSLASLSLNGDADGTYGLPGAKYLYTIGWATPVEEEAATVLADDTSANEGFPSEGNVVVGNIVVLTTTQNPNYVQEKLAPTEQNAQAGAELLDDAFVTLDPQTNAPDSNLAAIMNAVDAGAMTDKDLAAVAGASIATMGMALSGDVERQLSAIRNRTTSMGVNECVVNEGMPYFNAWVNAEGNRAELDKDGTDAGYKLDSWGGTVGFDVDLNPNFTMGMAITAMYGDLTADGPETKAEGDMDTYYVSLFARYASCAWTHTFVATVGMMDGSLDRTVNIGGFTYDTEGSVDGVTFGLLYEVGYVMPLNEEATACLQPVFNVMLRHTSIGSYTEKGSDAALDVDSQSMTTLTFGLGARMQAVVGENLYNRSSIFEARALAKVDLGDRRSKTDVGIVGGSRSSEIRSAELGAFGVELGAGLTIPLGDDDGSIFVDGAVELQSGYTNVNATVGYRINF